MSGRWPRRMPGAYRRARAAVRAGWRTGRTARHLAWISPAGLRVITPSAPGSRPGYLDDLSRLRRAGLRAPGRKRREAKAAPYRAGSVR